MRYVAILVVVSVLCSASAVEAQAQSYTLSLSTPTSGQNFFPGGSIPVSGFFTYPWPCLGLTCSPNVFVTLTNGGTLWYNVNVNSQGGESYGYGHGDFAQSLLVYSNMPWGPYYLDVWLSDDTANPPAGSDVLGTPVFLTVRVGP